MTYVFFKLKPKWLYSSVVERWICNWKITGRLQVGTLVGTTS